MLAEGFLQEVRRLREQPRLHADLPSMRSVGYRQAWEALADSSSPDREQLHQLRERGIAATRQLAKRQLTWLRSMPERAVVVCDADRAAEAVLQAASAVWSDLS